MARKPNTVGGGSKTNFNGLKFEARADLRDAIIVHPVYDLRNDKVYENGKVVAKYYEKHSLYKEFLAPNGVDYKNYLSKKLLPDGALLVGKTVYIIEKKYQAGSGSVDEKLQTCDFKKKQYIKLFKPLNIKVEYYYVLNDWFRRPEYEDVFEYIESVGCKYFIEELPLEEVGL
ncbi:MAG: hypothetical protein CMP80_00585 [Formosa sp.]|nr:hypothetical protein [Formosa sp.]|tara:strand:+ start:1040 stop:1558 length:519 start_codon:yes stop_codon:yes gene_type:complete